MVAERPKSIYSGDSAPTGALHLQDDLKERNPRIQHDSQCSDDIPLKLMRDDPFANAICPSRSKSTRQLNSPDSGQGGCCNSAQRLIFSDSYKCECRKRKFLRDLVLQTSNEFADQNTDITKIMEYANSLGCPNAQLESNSHELGSTTLNQGTPRVAKYYIFKSFATFSVRLILMAYALLVLISASRILHHFFLRYM